MRRLLFGLIITVTVVQVPSAQTDSSPVSTGFSIDFVDRTANACTDFYQFACGGWMARNPLPPDRSRLGRLQQLADRNDVLIREILERAAARALRRTDIEQKIGDYYASCMDATGIQTRGAQAWHPSSARSTPSAPRRS